MTSNTIAAASFPAHLTRIVDALANAPAQELFRELRHDIQRGQSENFTLAQAPDGTSWPLRVNHGHQTLDKGRGGWAGHPLLIDTGAMYQSITSPAGQDHVETIGPREMETGTEVPYAQFHEYGTDMMPARPFIGLADDHIDALAGPIADWGWEVIAGVS